MKFNVSGQRLSMTPGGWFDSIINNAVFNMSFISDVIETLNS